MNNFGGEIITGAGMTAGGPIANGPDGSPVAGAKAFRFCNPGTDPNEVGSSWIGQYVGQILSTRDGLLGWVWNGESWTEFSSNPTAIVKAGQSLAEGPDGLPPAGTRIFRFIDNGTTPGDHNILGTYRGQIIATRNGGVAWEWDGNGWILWDRQLHLLAGQYLQGPGPDGDPPVGAQAFRFINAGLDPNTEAIAGQYVGQVIATRDGISGWYWNGMTWTAYSPIPTSIIKAGQLIETGPDGAPPEDARAFRFIDVGTNPTTLGEPGRFVGQLIGTRDGLTAWEWNGAGWVPWARGSASPSNRVLVYEVDFSALPNQDVKFATVVIDGVTWKAVNLNQCNAAAIVNGTGLVITENGMSTTGNNSSNQNCPTYTSLLTPGVPGSLGAIYPLANPLNPEVLAVHFVAVFSPVPNYAPGVWRSSDFGICGNESLVWNGLPDTSSCNMLFNRFGKLAASESMPEGIQSGGHYAVRSSTGGSYGRGASNQPLAFDLSYPVQHITVTSDRLIARAAPLSAAPTMGTPPIWRNFQFLRNSSLQEWIGLARGWNKYLMFAAETGGSAIPTMILKSLHVYADLA